jgi:hypothetical protein
VSDAGIASTRWAIDVSEDKKFEYVGRQERSVASPDLRRLERFKGRFIETMFDQEA